MVSPGGLHCSQEGCSTGLWTSLRARDDTSGNTPVLPPSTSHLLSPESTPSLSCGLCWTWGSNQCLLAATQTCSGPWPCASSKTLVHYGCDGQPHTTRAPAHPSPAPEGGHCPHFLSVPDCLGLASLLWLGGSRPSSREGPPPPGCACFQDSTATPQPRPCSSSYCHK